MNIQIKPITYIRLLFLSVIVSTVYNVYDMYVEGVVDFEKNFKYETIDYDICHYNTNDSKRCVSYSEINLRRKDG